MSDLRADLDRQEATAARAFFADRLEQLFRSKPLEWIPIETLARFGGPSWRSRICDELRTQRGLNIPWNHKNRGSAYMWIPHQQLGRDASAYRTQAELF